MGDGAPPAERGGVPPDDLPSRAWKRYGHIPGWVGVGYLIVAAWGRLTYAIPHLLRDVEAWSAVDFKYRYGEVGQWFAGAPVYGVVDGAVYPPATHLILWPFMGWLSLEGARLLWTITILGAAFALAWLVWRVCAGAGSHARLLIAGLAFAAYPLQQSVFVGQLGVHVVALAAGGAYLAFAVRPWLPRDIVLSVMLAASLAKPTLSLPLVVAALIATNRARPALLTAAAYGALTLAAAAAQPTDLLQLFRDWLAVAGQRVPFADGVPSMHKLLAAEGLHAWMTPASLAALGVMAAWMWRRRTADPWVLMGVAGVVARIWGHSAIYDDAFLLLPVIALLRVVAGSTGRTRVSAAVLLAASWAALLTPTWAFYDLGADLVRTIHVALAVLWLAVLGFLVTVVERASSLIAPSGETVDDAGRGDDEFVQPATRQWTRGLGTSYG